MKNILVCSILVLGCFCQAPVNAQQHQNEYYQGLSQELRVALQRALLWTGHFVGISDGVFGKTSTDAVRRFQASTGQPVTGNLTKDQALALIRRAGKIQDDFGYRLFNDPYTGATIGLPEKFVRFSGLTKRGSQFVSPIGAVDMTTLRIPQAERSLFDLFQLHMNRRGRLVTYKVFRGDWFVVAGREDGKRFYVRAHSWQDDIRGFAISYPEDLASVFDRLTIAMSGDFKPDSGGLSVAQAQMNTQTVERGFGGGMPQPQAPAPPPAPQVAVAPPPAVPAKPAASPVPPATGGPVERLEGKVTTGTGFAVSYQGHILTNAHVVDACSAISVGSYGSARLIDRDATNDIALLKIDATVPTKALPLADASPQLGEEVTALGFPLQDLLQNGLNATRGDITSLAGIGGDSRMLQISAPVQPGNSGGPLLNARGEIVGVVTSKLNAAKVASAIGDIPQSINFAIRPEIAEIFMRRFGVTPVRLPADAEQKPQRHQMIANARDAVNVIICRK